MKYQKNNRRPTAEYEKDLVLQWKKNKTFEKSVQMRPADNAYVFYDGPPFITGEPHHGNLLACAIKDAIPRYQTMKGKRVERVWGWDCHGLPAETFTEQKLGIKDKRDIGTKVSLEEYIVACRDNMVLTGNEWNHTVERIGRWVDMDNAYKTMDKDYMESVWWAFSELYKKDKIYEGEKVLMYCTRDATPISKAEVAMDNSYQDDTDPTVYVAFKLENDDRYLLAWTTTPWTLPANSAIAINKDLEYVEAELNGKVYILAKNLVEKALTDDKHQPLPYKVLKTIKGSELVGKRYVPLFDTHKNLGDTAFKIWHADFVHDQEGTGIAHEAPAYGEEDYDLSKQEDFVWVLDTDESGIYTSGNWNGKSIWDVNKQIAKYLHERGDVIKIEYITHSYPHCHRCGTKLMYRAHPSWFMNIDAQRTKMLESNGDINWFPHHIKNGRFAKTVESAPDWNLSRDRFWATAMPVWKGVDKSGKTHIKVVGSYAELKELSGVELEDYHRPWIDAVTFKIDGVEYKRIDKVLDCWFESGSMPFAQFHYPFENKQKFEQNFPGDFIAEYVGQVRAWFYYLHAVSIGLFEQKSFKNVNVTGTIAGEDGRKMSKSFGNYTDPNKLMDTYSADALRFLLLSSPLLNGEDYSLIDKDVADVSRKLNMVWNMYDFFSMYAEVDNWEWSGVLEDPLPNLKNSLDIWIISRVHELTKTIDDHMSKYDLPNATKPILEFIEDASNWYVRRSRKRFWKSQNDSDKQAAYTTLHYVLVQLAIVMAPFTPFLAEELYQKLTDGESVHLLDWPEFGHINEQIIISMAEVRNIITQCLALRSQKSIKVRQPLASVSIETSIELSSEFRDVISEELNVKKVVVKKAKTLSVELDINITQELKNEGLAREIIRNVQQARKDAGLDVENRIILSLNTKSKTLIDATNQCLELIKKEVLATTLTLNSDTYDYQKEVEIENQKLTISLKKAV